MSGRYEAKLAELGVTLPNAPAPAANYVPFVKVGDMVHVSGQISTGPDGLIKGRLGDGMSVEDGSAAAKVCAINLLAQVKAACEGDLDRLVRVVKLGGFVNSAPDFTDQRRSSTERLTSWLPRLARPASMRARRSAWQRCRWV